MYIIISLLLAIMCFILGTKTHKVQFDTPKKFDIVVSLALNYVCKKHNENPQEIIKETLEEMRKKNAI